MGINRMDIPGEVIQHDADTAAGGFRDGDPFGDESEQQGTKTRIQNLLAESPPDPELMAARNQALRAAKMRMRIVFREIFEFFHEHNGGITEALESDNDLIGQALRFWKKGKGAVLGKPVKQETAGKDREMLELGIPKIVDTLQPFAEVLNKNGYHSEFAQDLIADLSQRARDVIEEIASTEEGQKFKLGGTFVVTKDAILHSLEDNMCVVVARACGLDEETIRDMTEIQVVPVRKEEGKTLL